MGGLWRRFGAARWAAAVLIAGCGASEPDAPGTDGPDAAVNASRPADGPLAVTAFYDLQPFIGDGDDWRRATGQAQSTFKLHQQLRYRVITGDVFVTQPLRDVVFENIALPVPAQLHMEVLVGPPGAFGGSSATIDALGWSEGAKQTRWSQEVELVQGGGFDRAKIALPLDTGAADELFRLSLTVRPTDPEAAKSGAAVVVVRPHARFEREHAAPAAAPRQVIVVTMDTLRSDHLGCYGNKQARTESIDAFAADSVRFTEAFTVSNVTNPSHTSIFSSVHPKDHSVRDNFTRMPEELPTMMSRLSEEGFRTAAFVGSANFEPDRLGLDKRFDDFYASDGFWERRAEDVNRDFFQWLDGNHDRDFFAWLHYFDVHMPYQPPAPYDAMYTEEGDGTQIELPLGSPEQLRIYGQERSLQSFKNRYMGELAYMDDRFGELVDQLRAYGVYDRSTLVVVADHGEAHGEYGVYCEHAGLHDVVTAVPLIIKAPQQAATGTVAGLVSTLDVYPTVFDWLGLAIEHPVRGQSLRPLMESEEPSEQGMVFSEHSSTLQISGRTAVDRAILGLEDRAVFPQFQTVQGKAELHRVQDGIERIADQAAQEAERTRRMQELLEAFLEDSLGHTAETISDPAYLERLRKLGYTR